MGCEMSRSRLGAEIAFFLQFTVPVDRAQRSPKGSARLSLIDGKFSIQGYIRTKTWKSSSWLFHVLILLLNIMENKLKFQPNPKLRLMDQVRQVLRYHHYSYRTEQTYSQCCIKGVKWLDYTRFVKFRSNQKHHKDIPKSTMLTGE